MTMTRELEMTWREEAAAANGGGTAERQDSSGTSTTAGGHGGKVPRRHYGHITAKRTTPRNNERTNEKNDDDVGAQRKQHNGNGPGGVAKPVSLEVLEVEAAADYGRDLLLGRGAEERQRDEVDPAWVRCT